MSAEVFLQSRDRITAAWVSAESCVQALEKRITRQKRGASWLKWSTFVFGLLTGGAGLEVLTPVAGLFKANGDYVLAILALITSGLTASAPVFAFDTKIQAATDAKHKFLDLQRDLFNLVYALAQSNMTPADDLQIAILEEKVAKEMRMDEYGAQAFLHSAITVSKSRGFVDATWLGPPQDAGGDVSEQGVAADLQPLTRG